MEHNNDDTLNTGNEGSHKFGWSTNSPSPSNTPSLILFVHLLQEIKENMPENTAFLTLVIASQREEEHLNL